MNISEIAKLAGVSNAAVSRYLNNGYLSEEKRALIGRVIAETGYRPMPQAQSLRNRKTRTVGVILPKIDSFSVSSVMAGIVGVLEQKDFQILLADSHNNPEKELMYLDLFDNQRVDGVILIATVLTPRHRALLKENPLPVVVVGQQISGISCVYHDDYHAFLDLTRFVLQKLLSRPANQCRVGYIGALTEDVAAGQERLRAYQDALREVGLEDQADHTVIARFTMESGQEKARELWERYGALNALICATDTMAAGALQFLRSQNIRVPEDILLTGHGASNICRVSVPSITTIQYYYEESGSTAASLLLEKMQDPELPAKELKLGYKIIENDSTG